MLDIIMFLDTADTARATPLIEELSQFNLEKFYDEVAVLKPKYRTAYNRLLDELNRRKSSLIDHIGCDCEECSDPIEEEEIEGEE